MFDTSIREHRGLRTQTGMAKQVGLLDDANVDSNRPRCACVESEISGQSIGQRAETLSIMGNLRALHPRLFPQNGSRSPAGVCSRLYSI